MKLEQVIKRPISEKEAESIVRTLERMGQVKSADCYREMAGKSQSHTGTEKQAVREEVNILSSRQKILSGIFQSNSKEIMEPIGRYLFMDRNLAVHAGIMSDSRSIEGCLEYVFDMAQKQAMEHRSSQVAVRDTVVFEWAEVYFLQEETEKAGNRTIVFSEPEKEQSAKKRTGKRNAGKKGKAVKQKEAFAEKSSERAFADDSTKSDGKGRGAAEGMQMSIFDLGMPKG